MGVQEGERCCERIESKIEVIARSLFLTRKSEIRKEKEEAEEQALEKPLIFFNIHIVVAFH